ncbi:pro-resilin-like [Macrobrachium rosenbergii]|uniref:pro-resilin-like n=1 Tax=Macrobrachium rosenbergii TaxID=79674 RepID=UPI0034D7673A
MGGTGDSQHQSTYIVLTINMYKVIIFASVMAAVVLSRPNDPFAPGYPDAPAVYEYKYGVKDDLTGNDFGHEEARDGYLTNGQYFVLLPDGRIQTVQYTVNGDEGYVANVAYSKKR